jgi:hypothetical protein
MFGTLATIKGRSIVHSVPNIVANLMKRLDDQVPKPHHTTPNERNTSPSIRASNGVPPQDSLTRSAVADSIATLLHHTIDPEVRRRRRAGVAPVIMRAGKGIGATIRRYLAAPPGQLVAAPARPSPGPAGAAGIARGNVAVGRRAVLGAHSVRRRVLQLDGMRS